MKKLQTNNNYIRFSLSFNVLCVYLQCQTIKTKLLWKSIYVMFVVGNTTRQLAPENGIEPGTAFEDLPEDWVCPLCGVGKDQFSPA